MEYKRTEKTGIHSKVCVLMSTYCGEKFLTEQLDSIRNQKGVDVKLIVRDDGSPDGGATMRLLRNYKQSYPEFDMEIQEGENLGFVGSFTNLIEYAFKNFPECNRFAFADQDDVWLDDKLNVASNQLMKAEHIYGMEIPLMYCSNTSLVDSNLQFIRNSWSSKEVEISKQRSLVQSNATGCTIVFTRKTADLYLNSFSSKIKVHDYWMFLVCVFFGKVIYDPIPHIKYRQHGNNQIGKPSAMARWKRRLSFKCSKSHDAETQAKLFLNAFKADLSLEDIELIGSIAFYRKNFFSKLALATDKRFYRPTLEGRISNWSKIIFGGGI